MPAND